MYKCSFKIKIGVDGGREHDEKDEEDSEDTKNLMSCLVFCPLRIGGRLQRWDPLLLMKPMTPTAPCRGKGGRGIFSKLNGVEDLASAPKLKGTGDIPDGLGDLFPL